MKRLPNSWLPLYSDLLRRSLQSQRRSSPLIIYFYHHYHHHKTFIRSRKRKNAIGATYPMRVWELVWCQWRVLYKTHWAHNVCTMWSTFIADFYFLRIGSRPSGRQTPNIHTKKQLLLFGASHFCAAISTRLWCLCVCSFSFRSANNDNHYNNTFLLMYTFHLCMWFGCSQ